MTVLAFKTTAGRDLILGQLMQAMRADDFSAVAAHTLDLLQRHANDPATLIPFQIAMEYLNDNNQHLRALRVAVDAVGIATPGRALMETAANLVINSADHAPGEDMRSVLDELSMAALQTYKDRRAFEQISEKLCTTAITCGDLHRDLAVDKIAAVIAKLVLPEGSDGNIADFYLEDEYSPSIDTMLPPDYAHALIRLADQFSTYDQGKSFSLYEIIVRGFSDQAIQDCGISEKLHALMVAAENSGRLELANKAAELLIDGGKMISPEIEDSASETMDRTNAFLNGETLAKDAKPVPLNDFLAAFPPPAP